MNKLVERGDREGSVRNIKNIAKTFLLAYDELRLLETHGVDPAVGALRFALEANDGDAPLIGADPTIESKEQR